MSSVVKNVLVVGGGLMGAGIAQVAAPTGHKVALTDVSQSVLDGSMLRINESLKGVAKKAHKEDPRAADSLVKSTLDRIRVSTSAKECFDNVPKIDLVIEAVTEKAHKEDPSA